MHSKWVVRIWEVMMIGGDVDVVDDNYTIGLLVHL